MTTAALSLPAVEAPSKTTFWRDMALVSGAAFAVRLLWSLLVVQGPMQGDAADYYREAVQLTSRLHDPFYWPPGTAYVLSAVFSLIGPSELTARIVMAAIAGLQAGMVGWVARLLSGSQTTGRVAAILWAVYPPSVFYAGQSGSQHLSAFCLTGGILYAFRSIQFPQAKNILLCGMLLGLGCLTRPSMLSVVGIVPLTAVFLWWQSRRSAELTPAAAFGTWVRPVLGALVVTGAVLVPTVLHNVRTGGGATLSINNERNFFLGNNPFTPWYKTSHLAQRSLSELPVDAQAYLRRHYDAENPRQAMKQAAWEHIREQPGLFVLRTLNRLRSFWGFDYIASRILQQTHGLRTPAFLTVLALEAGGYAAIVLLALMGLTRWSRLDPQMRVWLAAGTVAYAVPYAIAFSAGTYHFPALGLLIPFAAVALTNGERFEIPWKAFADRRWLVMAGLFLAIQAEYFYFTMRFAG